MNISFFCLYNSVTIFFYSYIQLHKIDHFNQYIWIEILDTNAKKMYIAICYFAPINSTFYKKNNLDKICPYNNLEKDIYNLKNEGNILLLGDFNARTATKQATLLSDDSNHNPLWLDEDLVLSNSYKRSSEDLLTGEIDRPSTGRVEPVRGCLITQAVWDEPP
jgi:hypothetical protein